MFQLTINGNVGGDPTMKFTPSGTAVTNFNVAVRSSRKDKETNEHQTYWVKCTAWGKQAELTAEYLRKGHKVLLSGEAGLDHWEGKDGTAHTDLTLSVSTIDFLTTKAEAGGRPVEASRDELDDLPF